MGSAGEWVSRVCLQYVDDPAWGTQGWGTARWQMTTRPLCLCPPAELPWGKQQAREAGSRSEAIVKGKPSGTSCYERKYTEMCFLPPCLQPPTHEGPGSQTVTDLVSSNRLVIWFVFLRIAILVNPLMRDQRFVHTLGCLQTNTYEQHLIGLNRQSILQNNKVCFVRFWFCLSLIK